MRFRELCMAWLWFIAIGCSTSMVVAQSIDDQKKPYRHLADLETGDAGRGKVVFENRIKCGCIKCHTADGTRSGVGPDLASIVANQL